jgi:hypothetical protein
LQTGKTSDGLVVWLENHSDVERQECALFLQQMLRYSQETKAFVARAFSGVYLVKPQHILAHARTDPGHLVHLPN